MEAKEKVKDYFTDLIGAVIMITTLATVYAGRTPWIWEGIAGMMVGSIFLLIPDRLISDILKKFLNKKAEGKDDA